MPHLQNKCDENDIRFIKEKGMNPVAFISCPEKDGKINPHVTRFLLEDGKITDVFHVKPIYYETIDGYWRPMDEIANGFGNKWIDLKADWAERCSLRYMTWLLKRMEIVRGKLKIPTPFDVKVNGESVESPLQLVMKK